MYEESSQPTQPATQQVLDPRRLGRNNSGLSEGDISDVLAILHPATPTAIKIVENAAESRPQHVLFRNPLDSLSGSMTDIEEQETIIMNGNGEKLGQSSRAGADLALRMTSVNTLRFKELGFIFGRNANSADIVFGQDTAKRISNQHFRIYLNADGVMMIEDMSTNGTIVDDQLLKNKDKRFSKIRMLSSGSIICIQNSNDDEMIKFIVRVPSRVTYLERFRENLRKFIAECTPGEDKNLAVQRVNQQYLGPKMKWDGGSKYNIIGMLGKGAFATVHQLATKMDGRLLAAKELEKRRFMKNGMLDKKIDNEMKIMQGLRHPNIVEFIEYHDEGDYLYIVMEFARQGDLQAYLSQVGTVKEPVARSLAQQILSALAYLHRANITHRDIKPDNILISEIDPLTVKLSDFGLSKVVKHDETFLKTFCGTLLYCAPEVFPEYTAGTKHGTKRRRGAKQYHSYSSSVDIWSFGGVLWYALCGEPPFKGIADATGEAMFKNIMATPLDTTPLQRKGVSAVCIDLLTRMLRTDPALRPTDRECLNHPWLKEGARIPADPTLQSIVEVDEDDTEHQLSQMSLHVPSVCVSDDEYDEDILSDDEMLGMMTSKRVRADPRYPRNQARDHVSSADASFQSGLPIEEGESFRIMAPLRRPRLFGEIGQSALQSSGVLSARANDALPRAEVTGSGPHDSVGGAERFYTPVGALHDRSSSSPGLGGTESMVRDLNMASPHSRTQSPAMPTTPGTPEVVQHKSLQQSSKEASQVSEPTPKARPTNRQFSLPRTASYFYDPSDPRTHNLEYATRVSGYNFVAAQQSTEAGASAYEDVGGQSDTSDHSGYSTAVGSAASPPGIASSHFAQADIKPPPRRFGKLVATSDSFAPNLVLHISESQTSWGRLPSCTIVYPEGRDTRIPKTAFVVFFYSASESGVTVEQLAAEGKDWTTLPGLQVGIWACATRGISINGWNLKRTDDKGRALFGHLHTGDIIKVYQDAAGSEFLQFRCEFYLGAGKESRPVNESFTPLTGKKLEG